MPGCLVYAGRTATKADEPCEKLQDLIAPEPGVPYLFKMANMDFE